MSTDSYLNINSEKKVKETIANIGYLLNKAEQISKNMIGEMFHKLTEAQTKHEECTTKFTHYQEKATSLIKNQANSCLEDIADLKDYYSNLQKEVHDAYQEKCHPNYANAEELKNQLTDEWAKEILEDKQRIVNMFVQTYEERIKELNAAHEEELQAYKQECKILLEINHMDLEPGNAEFLYQ